MLNLPAGFPFLLVSLFLTSVNSAPNDKAEFRSLAKQIAARINQAGGTEESASATKVGSYSDSSTYRRTLSYSGVSISDDGVLKYTSKSSSSLKFESANKSRKHLDFDDILCKHQLPLNEVSAIRVGILHKRPDGLKPGKMRKTKDKAKLLVSQLCHVQIEGKGISYHASPVVGQWDNNPKSIYIYFKTKAEAALFAKDLHRLVTALGDGKRVGLRL